MLKGLTALMPKDSKAYFKFKEKHLIMVILILLSNQNDIIIKLNLLNLLFVPYLPCLFGLVYQHGITIFCLGALLFCMF